MAFVFTWLQPNCFFHNRGHCFISIALTGICWTINRRTAIRSSLYEKADMAILSDEALADVSERKARDSQTWEMFILPPFCFLVRLLDVSYSKSADTPSRSPRHVLGWTSQLFYCLKINTYKFERFAKTCPVCDLAASHECWRLFAETGMFTERTGSWKFSELLHYKDKAKWLLWSCGGKR